MLEEIIGSLDLLDFQVCIRCKDKQTNKRNFGAKRAKDDLEPIQIDIFGLFPTNSRNGQRYVKFIDNYSLFNLWEVSASRRFKSFKASWTSISKEN